MGYRDIHQLSCQLSLWHIAREGQVEHLESEHHTIFYAENDCNFNFYEVYVSA